MSTRPQLTAEEDAFFRDMMEKLACKAHQQWCAEAARQSQKFSELYVDWDALPESVRQLFRVMTFSVVHELMKLMPKGPFSFFDDDDDAPVVSA